MTPVACPFPDCSRYAGHPGPCNPLPVDGWAATVEASSFGTPEAKAIRDSVPDEVVERIRSRAAELDLPEADRCYRRADGTCGRVDHPTVRSACNQETSR